MRITLTNGKMIDLKFRKEELSPGIVRSYCRISKVKDPNAKGRDNYVPIIESFSTRNPHDLPNKGEGFKRALSNALAALAGKGRFDKVFFRNNGFFLPRLQDEADRKLIWSAFLSVYKKYL